MDARQGRLRVRVRPDARQVAAVPRRVLPHARAAERGAQRALADVGLDGDYAETDIRDLRTLLRAINLAKKTAWQTFIRVLTAGILTALVAGIAIKLKIFGGN